MTIKPSDYNLPTQEWRPYQLETIQWVEDITEGVPKITEQPTGCHAKGQGILMYDGTIKNVEDVVVDDLLMGPDSFPRIVSELHRGVSDMYKIVPVKGDPFIVNGDHILTLVRTNCDTDHRNKRRDCLDGTILEITVLDYLKLSKTQKHIHKLFRTYVRFEKKKLPIDPYFMGVMLGDGSITKNSIAITTMDSEIKECVYEIAKSYGLDIRVQQKSDNLASTYYIASGKKKGITSQLFISVRELGISGVICGNKFIPHIYKTSSRDDRLKILAGLLDTDGSLAIGYYDYITKSKRLADDVAFIARSLGFAAYINLSHKECQTGNGGLYYRISISGDINEIPCRIPSKIYDNKRLQKKDVLRTGFTVEYVGIDEYYGFSVIEDKLKYGFSYITDDPHYLLDDFTVVHNSGKSLLAMAQGSKERRVLVLTKTKSLQLQYEKDRYDAKIMFGKGNYPCSHKLLPVTATAEDCKYPGHMERCDIANHGYCAYYNARRIAQLADRVVFNYALWFSTHKSWHPDYLIMDEAHNVSDMVLEHVGFELSEHTRQRYNLPELPLITAPSQFAGFAKPTDNLDKILEWTGATNRVLERRIGNMDMSRLKERDMVQLRIWRNYKNKMEVLGEALQSVDVQHWFIRSGPTGINGQPGLLCKPITARYHTKNFFYRERMMFMSATIGDVPTFAAELGLEKYEYRIVDSVWPMETRPVYALPCPSMGKSATDKDPLAFEKQADEIAKAIHDCPRDWSGYVLVTRKAEANLLAERLARRGLADRAWVTPGWDEPSPTDQQITAWENYRTLHPNAICISWSFWEGIDGKTDKILIVAKAPYVMESEYERARRTYDPKMYLQRAAYVLEQGLGRTRRGNPEDYDEPQKDIQRGLVCIADASWKKLKPYMSKAIKDAIIEL